MLTNSGEELAGGELNGDIRLLKSVDSYKVIVRTCSFEKGATILHIDVQVRLVHNKILASNVDNGRIDFDAINGNWAIDLCKLVSDGASGQANNCNAMQLLWREAGVEVWRGEKIIPVPACQDGFGIGVVDRVDSFSFIEDELSCAIGELCHLDIVVEGFLFVDQIWDLFKRSQRQHERDQYQGKGRSQSWT